MPDAEFKEVSKQITAAHVRDDVLHMLAKAQGFDGLPDIADIDKIKGPTMYRGLTDESFGRQFQHGEYFPGVGIHGNGTYTAIDTKAGKGIDVAREYAKTDGKILAMKLKPGAGIASYESVADKGIQQKWAEESARGLEAEDAKKTIARLNALFGEPGRFAIAQGYDAIKIEKEGYIIVLNRRAVVVSAELLDPKE